MDRMWILGASDPEMQAIEELLASVGEKYAYAVVRSASRDAVTGTVRVHPGNAYRGECHRYAVDCGPAGSPEAWYLVECQVPVPDYCEAVVIDHHRSGDPGFGKSPKEFFSASSIGQVIAELAQLGVLRRVITRHEDEEMSDDERYRGGWLWSHNRDLPSGGDGGDGGDGIEHAVSWARDCHAVRVSGGSTYATCEYPTVLGVHDSVAIIPRHYVFTAAADHCLGAAYRGECPGVDPDQLMQWRAASRAAFQGRDVADILEDIRAAQVELAGAPWLNLGLLGEPVVVRDMRRETPVPELPEAALRIGASYIAGPMVTPDGRRKITCSGTPEVIRAFLDQWAPSNGITDMYGDPARGFAGGYCAAPAGLSG